MYQNQKPNNYSCMKLSYSTFLNKNKMTRLIDVNKTFQMPFFNMKEHNLLHNV